MFKHYISLIKKCKNNTLESSYKQNGISNLILRYLSFFITPFFIFLNFHPNHITILRLSILLIGLCFVLLKISLLFGLILIHLNFILDFVDGDLARYKNLASYFGKFVDGFIDGISFPLIQLSLFFYFYDEVVNNKILFAIIIFSIILDFIHNLAIYNASNFQRMIYIDKKLFHKDFIFKRYFDKSFLNYKRIFFFILVITGGNFFSYLSYVIISLCSSSFRITKTLIFVFKNFNIHKKSAIAKK